LSFSILVNAEIAGDSVAISDTSESQVSAETTSPIGAQEIADQEISEPVSGETPEEVLETPEEVVDLDPESTPIPPPPVDETSIVPTPEEQSDAAPEVEQVKSDKAKM